MNIMKLAKSEHDICNLHAIAHKCITRIDSCTDARQIDSCMNYIGFAELNITIQENILEYTPFRLLLCRVINRDKRHKEFIDEVNTTFAEVRAHAYERLEELQKYI